MSTLDTALRLLQHGYWPVAIRARGEPIHRRSPRRGQDPDEPGVVPVAATGKEPLGKDWGLERWTEARLRDELALQPGRGLGVCLGPGRGPGGAWLIDLEGDGPEAAQSLATVLGGETLETPGWGSTRGDHVLHTADGERLLTLLTAAGATEGTGTQAGVYHLAELPGLEWRVGGRKPDGAVKQIQSVVPPTPGTDGRPRTWRVTPRTPPAPLPAAVYAYLERLAAAKRAAAAGAAGPARRPQATTRADDPHDHQSVLRRALDEFAGAAAGGRHAALLRWSLPLAARVKGGALSEREVVDGLYAAAHANGMLAMGRQGEIDAAWRSAMALATPWVNGRAAPGRNGLAPSGTGDDGDDAPIVLPEWPAPPETAAYHGLAGEIVRAIEPESEADPIALLAQLLIGFGSVIGPKAYMGVGAAQHRANEFAALVGETSAARKGTSWSEVYRFLAAVDPGWRDKRILGGLSSGEGLIYHVRDPLEGREPIREKGKVTGYQDVIVDHGVADKRLLVVETEFAGVLQVAKREGNKLSAVMRQAWDGSTLASMTKSFPYRATGAHVSIIAHITAEELTKLLTQCDQANGFANRFLWVCCRRSKLLPFGGRVPQEEVDRLRARLSEAAAFAATVELVKWTGDAMDLWRDAYPRLTRPRAGALGMVTSRAEAHALRLALLYALLDRSERIEAEHLRAALAVWGYCVRSAAYIFGEQAGDRDADIILEALRSAPSGLTRSEIRRGLFGGNKPAASIATKLAMLLRMGLVRSESVPTPGRPAERWIAVETLRHNAINAISPPQTPAGPPYGVYGVQLRAADVAPGREVYDL